MQTRKLDANEDMTFGHGKGNLLQGKLAVQQMVKNALLLIQGDWFLNRLEGIPYFAQSFLQPQNIPLISSIIKNVILAVPGVASILRFQTNLQAQKRSITIESVLLLDSGETISINQPI